MSPTALDDEARRGLRTHADRISAARRQAGLTQRELADRLGTSLWAIEQIESGRHDPRRYAARIEQALGRETGSLLAAGLTAERSAPHPKAARVPSVMAPDLLGRDLVLITFAIMITIRFFTESIALLPAAGNFVDVLLLPILLAAVAFMPSLRSGPGSRPSPYSLLALAFVAICAISVVLNSSRVAYAPVLLFIYGFIGPILFYLATYRLWPVGQAMSLSRVVVALGVLQFFVIAIFDLPTFVSSRNPDEIVGTFGGNAYQLVFFLLVFAALVAGISVFEPQRRVARFAPLIFGATFLVIFLAQYRALLVSTVLTLIVIVLMLRYASGKGVLVAAAIVLTFAVGLGYVSTRLPELKFLPTIEAISSDPGSFVTARFAPANDVASLYGDDTAFIATGTGPGTFSSRAWRTFAEVGDAASAEGAAQPYASALTGGEAYHTDVSDRYVVPRASTARAVLGSTALTSPFSSYIALLAEVGVIGFVLMLTIYARATLHSWNVANLMVRTRPSADPLPALAMATFVAFLLLLQLAFLENWWEVARVTVPSWMMLAVCTKEFAARTRRLDTA